MEANESVYEDSGSQSGSVGVSVILEAAREEEAEYRQKTAQFASAKAQQIARLKENSERPRNAV